MKNTKIHLSFLGDLSIFLSKHKRAKSLVHFVKDRSSVKDVIESLGIPHTEVDAIVVNGISVDFSYLVNNKDHIKVYPDASRVKRYLVKDLKPKINFKPRFIIDVHLGKLAKALRLLGFDVLFDPELDDPDIIKIGVNERRIILTCDHGILKHSKVKYGYYVRSTGEFDRVTEVIKRFKLKPMIKPLSRCAACNGPIIHVAKEEILDKLEPLTKKYYNEFYKCQTCQQIYWKGSHFQKLTKKLKQFL